MSKNIIIRIFHRGEVALIQSLTILSDDVFNKIMHNEYSAVIDLIENVLEEKISEDAKIEISKAIDKDEKFELSIRELDFIIN